MAHFPVDYVIAKRELHQALTRERPTQPSRKVLSKARYVTKGELKNSRKAVPEPEPRKRKSKAKEAPRPSKRAQRVRDEDVVEAGDSEAEREVDRLMHLDGERVVQEEEEDPLQSQFGGHLERAPLAETSANASRRDTGGIRIRGVVGKGRGGGGGRGRGQGKAVAS